MDGRLGFYAIHKPTRRNPKEKHTNSASRMRGGMGVLFHIFLKHMEQKTIPMRSFLHQERKFTAFFSHSFIYAPSEQTYGRVGEWLNPASC